MTAWTVSGSARSRISCEVRRAELQLPLLHQRAHDLDNEERVPLGLLVQPIGEIFRALAHHLLQEFDRRTGESRASRMVPTRPSRSRSRSEGGERTRRPPPGGR